jgi:hypothetical protein
MQTLIAICVCLILAFGVQTFRIGALKEEAAQQKAALATAQATAEKEAREREQAMADSARKASDAYQANVNRVRASADGARTELERLRDAIAAAGPAPANPASAAGTDDATRARFVVGQLANAAAQVSAAADACESRLSALQDYVKGIIK